LCQVFDLTCSNSGKQEIKILLGQLVCQVTQHGHEERIRDVLPYVVLIRNDDANGSVFTRAQIFGTEVDAVTERFGQVSDSLASFLVDQWTAVQSP